MTESQLKEGTRDFALRVLRLTDALPRTRAADVLGRQLLRCATSVGANYRAACRARSRAEFAARLGIAEEEADESGYWLSLLADSRIVPGAKLRDLRREAAELTAIFVSSIKTARRKCQSRIPNPKSRMQRERNE